MSQQGQNLTQICCRSCSYLVNTFILVQWSTTSLFAVILVLWVLLAASVATVPLASRESCLDCLSLASVVLSIWPF